MLALPRLLTAGASLVMLILCSSCVMTREEGDQLERDIQVVQDEFAEFKLEQQRKEAERIAGLRRMADSLEQSDETARKADADFFLKIDQLVQEVQRLSGRIEEMEHRLAKLEAAQASVQPSPETTTGPATAGTDPASEPADDSPPLPEDKQELYDLAKKTHDEGDYGKARDLFRHFHKRFPDDDVLSDNSLYWIGEGHYKEGAFDKAILTFQEVINKYPKSDKLDAALYKIGRSFESLGLKEDAVLFYQDLVKKYPKSKLVRDAKKRIKSAKKKKRSRRRSG